jgi:hypothetical protein
MLVITMNLDLNNVKLVKDKYQIKNIFIDDKEIKGVTKITYTEEVDSVNSVIIEMLVNKLEIEDCNEIDTLKEKIKELENEIKQLKNKEWIDKIIPYEPYIPPKVWYYKYDKPLDHGDDGFFHLHL